MKPINGFGVMEMIVAIAIVGLVFFSIYQFALISFASVHSSGRRVTAAYLAEEGIEAVRTLRNQSWSGNISSLASNLTYYPTIINGNWQLVITNPGTIANLFTRTVNFQSVVRDANDNITGGSGVLDPHTKKVIVTVSWSEKTGSQQIVLETYLTNFLDN